MKFSLPATVVLFCATTTLAFPATNDVVAQEEGLDLSDIDIVDVEYNPDDFLTTRDTKHCANNGPIKRVKPEYKGKCNPANSRGFFSAHNCKKYQSGKSYLCVQGDTATCYNIDSAQSKQFENGECFKTK